jgi:hypothetical protein
VGSGATDEQRGFVHRLTRSPAVLYSLASLFYSSKGGSSWYISDSWLNSTNECEWYGVVCQSDDGSSTGVEVIRGLNLTGNGLDGTIPSDLAILSNLLVLDMSNNQLMGSIPDEMGY